MFPLLRSVTAISTPIPIPIPIHTPIPTPNRDALSLPKPRRNIDDATAGRRMRWQHPRGGCFEKNSSSRHQRDVAAWSHSCGTPGLWGFSPALPCCWMRTSWSTRGECGGCALRVVNWRVFVMFTGSSSELRALSVSLLPPGLKYCTSFVALLLIALIFCIREKRL